MTALVIRVIVLGWCLGWGNAVARAAQPENDRLDVSAGRMWNDLLAGAASLQLPTTFLKAIPPGFIWFEFEDLRTYAAEYHQAEHRMVLNRVLSFNAAGRTLRPLASMNPKDLEVLYHELFHAYMDWIVSRDGIQAVPPDPLLAFARAQQRCRYQEVAITPVVQRAHETESRYLTENEAWEALNETWAVFVGWAVWNQLELERKNGGSVWQQPRLAQLWRDRLQQAARRGELRGYYVPEDSDERRIVQKRFLAASSQISTNELVVLMKQVIGLPDEFVSQTEKIVGAFLSPVQKECSEGISR